MLLVKCQRRNIRDKFTSMMYDLDIEDESLDATSMSYLEGDYYPGEAKPRPRALSRILTKVVKRTRIAGLSKSKGRGGRSDEDDNGFLP